MASGNRVRYLGSRSRTEIWPVSPTVPPGTGFIILSVEDLAALYFRPLRLAASVKFHLGAFFGGVVLTHERGQILERTGVVGPHEKDILRYGPLALGAGKGSYWAAAPQLFEGSEGIAGHAAYEISSSFSLLHAGYLTRFSDPTIPEGMVAASCAFAVSVSYTDSYRFVCHGPAPFGTPPSWVAARVGHNVTIHGHTLGVVSDDEFADALVGGGAPEISLEWHHCLEYRDRLGLDPIFSVDAPHVAYRSPLDNEF